MILVTGAAGFLGSHVAGALLGRGHSIVGIDNFDPFYDRRLKDANAAAVRAAGAEFELLEADICDEGAVRSLLQRTRPEGVIHLAAKAGVRPSIADPAGYARANVLGTSVLLEAARWAGCSRFVMASSSSVYGNNRRTPFSEDHAVEHPISPYAATKRACELIAFTHWSLTKMPTACLRFFTVFGPRQRPDLAISAFMRRIGAGEPIDVFGDGSMARDFTYVDDIVAGVLAAYERVAAHGYRVWNLGSDRPVRLDEMVAAVERTVGRDAVVNRKPMQPGDVERTWADLTRSRAELGYSPSTPFEEGLRRQWRWYQEATAAPSRT
ncbi:MAG: GDP-mannose 4,6-dehydratase [Phycisphaerales bacterium]|nr:GDP-mannose 4,6-dehydratase [Phycisphaerales bacterium]